MKTMPLSVRVDAGMPWVVTVCRKVVATISAVTGVGGDGQGVAGVVVEPGEDLDVAVVSQAVVGEVALPGLVGQRGLEAVGRTWSFLRLRADQSGPGEAATDTRESW